MEHPWLDTSQRPIVVETLPHSFTEQELQAYFDFELRFYETLEAPVVWILDLSQTKMRNLDAAARRKYAEHQKRVAPHEEKWCRGAAIVAPAAWMRGAYTAVMWISPPPFPHKALKTLEEAKAWAQRHV